MFAFGFHLLLLHSPPTLSLLWSIRLSVHSLKWLWHLLKRPVECSSLKGYPMLWPKTTRFLFFSLSFPSNFPLWHCAVVGWLWDLILNKFSPMKDTPFHHYLPSKMHTPSPNNTYTSSCFHTYDIQILINKYKPFNFQIGKKDNRVWVSQPLVGVNIPIK